MRADTARPYTDTDFQTNADLMKQHAPARVAFVRCEVERLMGVSPRSCN